MFLAILNAIAQIEGEGRVDVFSIVLDLRKQRAGMVQTSRQYQGIYDVALRWYETQTQPRLEEEKRKKSAAVVASTVVTTVMC